MARHSIGLAGIAPVLGVAEIVVTEASEGILVVNTDIECNPWGHSSNTAPSGQSQSTAPDVNRT